jgi:hypothetical protein
MKINIYTSLNGVGLEKDYKILRSIFEAAGHTVSVADYFQRRMRPERADVAIHLEIPRFDLMSMAGVNYMMPNPEWFIGDWMRQLNKFNAILCKTHDCERVFKDYSKRIYTGFTSLDFYQPIKKQKQLIHIQGKSDFKGTNEIIQAYAKAELPRLFLLSKKGTKDTRNIVNAGFLSDGDFSKLINCCLIHICPSLYEGYGHYIWEAMSCGNVVITTDAAPMSEFITDERFLVKTNKPWRHHQGVMNPPLVDSLIDVIGRVYAMDEAELIAAGEANMAKFLANDADFRDRILSVIS